MPLHPVDEVTPEFIRSVRDLTTAKLLKKAMSKHKSTKPTDWCAREMIIGDANVSDILDVTVANTQNAGVPTYTIDAASLTGNDLSSIFASGETVNDQTYIGIYGFWDACPEGMQLTGAADQPPLLGSIASVKFTRGGSDLDMRQTQHLYGYQNVVGITDRPVLFDENQKIDIKVNSQEATEDKSIGFRSILLERVGQNFSPWNTNPKGEDMVRNVPGVGPAVLGGLIPYQELSPHMMGEIKREVMENLFQLVVNDGLAKNIAEAKEEWVIRELHPGDETNATDFTDLDTTVSTAWADGVTTGAQLWAQDATTWTSQTEGDLSNILVSGETVPDNKFISVFGFTDLSPHPLNTLMSLEDSAMRDVWEIEHCLAYHDGPVGGMTERPTYFKQNSKIVIKGCVNVTTGVDTALVPRGYICERYGEIVSKR